MVAYNSCDNAVLERAHVVAYHEYDGFLLPPYDGDDDDDDGGSDVLVVASCYGGGEAVVRAAYDVDVVVLMLKVAAYDADELAVAATSEGGDGGGRV